jgi:hypothetical protein
MNQKRIHSLPGDRVTRVVMCLALAFLITTLGFASQTPLTAVSGLVRDANGPVAGATVRVKATENKVITDIEGNFVLSGLSPNEPVVLTAWAEGYYIGGGQARYLPGDSDIEIVLTAHSDIDNPDYAWLRIRAARIVIPSPIIHRQLCRSANGSKMLMHSQLRIPAF